jgi:hypothetical protein
VRAVSLGQQPLAVGDDEICLPVAADPVEQHAVTSVFRIDAVPGGHLVDLAGRLGVVLNIAVVVLVGGQPHLKCLMLEVAAQNSWRVRESGAAAGDERVPVVLALTVDGSGGERPVDEDPQPLRPRLFERIRGPG